MKVWLKEIRAFETVPKLKQLHWLLEKRHQGRTQKPSHKRSWLIQFAQFFKIPYPCEEIGYLFLFLYFLVINAGPVPKSEHCYVCAEARPCKKLPVHVLLHKNIHAHHYQDIHGLIERVWRGRVWQSVSARIYDQLFDKELLKEQNVFHGMSRQEALERIPKVKQFF